MKKMKQWITFGSILNCIFLAGCGTKSPGGESKTIVPSDLEDFEYIGEQSTVIEGYISVKK